MSNKKLLDDYVSNIQLHLREGDLNRALKEIKDALISYPTNPKLYINGGNIYKVLGDLDSADLFFNKALSIHKSKEVLNNLSVINLERRNYDQAILLAKEAIEIDPSYVEAIYNLALCLDSLGNYHEAEKYSNKACSLDNYKNTKYLVLLFRILQNTCNWKDLLKISKMLNEAVGDGVEHPFLNISRTDNEKMNYSVSTSWSNDRLNDKSITTTYNEKIKLGYFCGEFRNHPTNHLIKNLFKYHDTSRFEVYIFSYNHDDESRDYIKNNVFKFVELDGLDNTKATQKMIDCNLDILIDLTIIITNNRQEIIHNRPAKKIISYLGYPGTSGSSIYDYIITDKIVTPISQQKYYTEKFLYLPRTYQINDGRRLYKNKNNKSHKKDHGLPESSIVLSCFNQSFKIEEVMLSCWLDILKQVSNSFLWLLEDNEASKENIYSFAKNRGIEESRIVFAPRINRADHLLRLQLSNVTLDTMIYNGHTTTTDSLQSAVPVVTLIGNHFASRVSASLLTSIGLEELVTKNISEYKSLAIRLVSDSVYFNQIKNNLLNDDFNNDFYNIEKFVVELEDSLISIIN